MRRSKETVGVGAISHVRSSKSSAKRERAEWGHGGVQWQSRGCVQGAKPRKLYSFHNLCKNNKVSLTSRTEGKCKTYRHMYFLSGHHI